MGKIKRMEQIKQLLLTYQTTASIKATASRLQVSKNTVRHYLRRAETHDPDLEQVLALSDDELRRVLYPDKAGAVADRRLIFDGKVDYWIRELQRPHVTRQTLFEEYRREYPARLRPDPVLHLSGAGRRSARPYPGAASSAGRKDAS